MPFILTAWDYLAALPLAIWIYLLVARGGYWRTRVAGTAAVLPDPLPRVAVIVPARDEEDSIGAAVASLAGQDYPGEFIVSVVDDHSSDATAERARSAGAGRVRVVAAGPLEPGWTGKLWALQEGVRALADFQPDFYLFTDADVVHPPHNLRRLVSTRADLSSLMVKLRCESLAERALIPAFVYFFQQLYPPAWIADPRRDTAGAAGGCVLVHRRILEEAGGLAVIRDAVIDDCALAALIKRRGGRLRLDLALDTFSLRRYESWQSVGRMIARTAFTQLRYSTLRLGLTVAGLFATYLAPPLLAFTPFGAFAWALMAVSFIRMLRFYRRSLLWAPLLPAIALFYTGATVWSAIQYWRGRGAGWKGRVQAPTSKAARES